MISELADHASIAISPLALGEQFLGTLVVEPFAIRLQLFVLGVKIDIGVGKVAVIIFPKVMFQSGPFISLHPYQGVLASFSMIHNCLVTLANSNHRQGEHDQT